MCLWVGYIWLDRHVTKMVDGRRLVVVDFGGASRWNYSRHRQFQTCGKNGSLTYTDYHDASDRQKFALESVEDVVWIDAPWAMTFAVSWLVTCYYCLSGRKTHSHALLFVCITLRSVPYLTVNWFRPTVLKVGIVGAIAGIGVAVKNKDW